jgi:tRNA threonylcarbamoyladenosine biosynthesis protein TsaE
LKFYTKTAEETIALGEKIGANLQRGDILALCGMLAAGKTVLTKGIARALKITEPVTSPTFTIISEYAGTGEETMPLFHIDAYRLEGASDFVNLGVEEILYGNGVCVIEWAEKIRDALPKGVIEIQIGVQADGSREITVDNWKYGDLR